MLFRESEDAHLRLHATDRSNQSGHESIESDPIDSDGDEAFDDGGHALQFDQDGKARVIAFKNVENVEDLAGTVADLWLTSDEVYGILETWQRKFENEWEATLERQKSEKVVYLPYRHPIKVKKE